MVKLPSELNSKQICLKIENPPDIKAVSDSHNWAAIGQKRAIEALKMGISIRAKGYNIFVVGDPGTGKHTAIIDMLRLHRGKNDRLRDIVYVQNFDDPDKPRHLIFPGGQARRFKEDLARLIKRLETRIGRDLDSESYKARKVALIQEAEKMENKALVDFENQLNASGFRVIRTEEGREDEAMDIAPVIDGKTVRFEELQEMVPSGLVSEETWNETRELYFGFINRMNRIHRDFKIARETLQASLKQLRADTVRPGAEEECALIGEQWSGEDVKAYLREFGEDVIRNAHWFSSDNDEEEEIDTAIRYGVNIVLDRHGTEELPVISETNPAKVNLFGSIEAHHDPSGELRTNIMMIKAGSLLRADGGYLILQAEDVFSREGLWADLKRVLQTGHVVPEAQSTPLGPLPILMKPEPIITETKVILIGSETVYDSICEQDEDIFELFKVTAEFSPVMPRGADTESEYAAFIRSLALRENLREISANGIREIIAYGIHLAERRDKLSTYFGLIADLIRESDYMAASVKRSLIDKDIVRKAIAHREFISSLPEQEILEQIGNGTIIIETDGCRVGTVNGLAVLERGTYAFGTPLRITATVSPGKEGLLNIEREAGLSGELHDKGMLLMEGYIRRRFARRRSLSLTGSIAVEQSYYEIDGDSASAAELAALLSAIAELPVRQDIAITGAVNQQGEIQPVGSVQIKIQGFFNVCSLQGLSGSQGVAIPTGNIENVILSPPLIKAVEEGQFHIWTVNTMDEVLTLLTGLNAGRERRGGRFESGSVNSRIQKGLLELAELS
ncbi:MAG: hypothetical protein B0D92_05680 [Spirochaeta sp. LUC14_002_19_P3]|nr:MAG: hypothetical protein B0D92_05680 [Spirochaeta sp. LUC14_002_19_P3]